MTSSTTPATNRQRPGGLARRIRLKPPHTSPESIAGKGIDDVVDHYTNIIGDLPANPIVIGHSLAVLFPDRLLSNGSAAAALAIDPAPIRGVVYLPPSAVRVASIALRNPANRNRAISLTAGQFRYGFANAVSADEAATLYERWAIPSREDRCLKRPQQISSATRQQEGFDTRKAWPAVPCCPQPAGGATTPSPLPSRGRRSGCMGSRQHGSGSAAVPRPRALPHHRQWLARGRRYIVVLDQRPRTLTGPVSLDTTPPEALI